MIDFKRDFDGRILIIPLEIAGLYTVTIINIYGPNREDPLWFNSLFDPDYDLDSDYVVFAGDWNVCCDEIDFYNYNTQRNLKNMEEIKKGIKKLDLVDIWRLQNPCIKKFTWGTKKPFKRARLDYFLISENLLSFCPVANILPSYRSDHNIITLSFNISNQERGKGSWKLNNKLLENKN